MAIWELVLTTLRQFKNVCCAGQNATVGLYVNAMEGYSTKMVQYMSWPGELELQYIITAPACLRS